MKKSMLFVLLIVSLAVVLSTTSAMASMNNANGAACRAANLNQAFGLSWDHARIWNTSPYDRWVLCPVERAFDYVEDTGGILKTWVNGSLTIKSWFGPTVAPGAAITCIVREMDADVTTTVAVNAVSHVINQTGGALPEVVGQDFNMTGYANFFDPFTVACKLPPGAGINAIHMNFTWVDNSL